MTNVTKDTPNESNAFGRRTFLKGTALTGAVAAGFLSAQATPLVASADVPSSPEFDVHGSGGNYFFEKQLHQPNWIMESFGINYARNAIYGVQHKGDPTAAQAGDLWISRIDVAGTLARTSQPAMTVHGFGHGVQIGVEIGSSTDYLWSEGLVETGQDPTQSFGTVLARFPFTDGAALEYYDPTIRYLNPYYKDSSAHSPLATVDQHYGRLVLRYAVTGGHRIVTYNLADAVAATVAASAGYVASGNQSNVPKSLPLSARLSDYLLAVPPATPSIGPFQGFAAYGQYYYALNGASGGDSYITVNDMNSGALVDTFKTTAGASLSGREPQGMSVAITGSGSNPSPQLAFGFKSSTPHAGAPTDYYSSIYYKNSFV